MRLVGNTNSGSLWLSENTMLGWAFDYTHYKETGAICPAVALHGHMYACQ
jgi:hypothetical protein